MRYVVKSVAVAVAAAVNYSLRGVGRVRSGVDDEACEGWSFRGQEPVKVEDGRYDRITRLERMITSLTGDGTKEVQGTEISRRVYCLHRRVVRRVRAEPS